MYLFDMKRRTMNFENKDDNRGYSFILEAVETETDLGYVEEGDVIDADMVVEPEDIDLTELVGFAKEVCVDKKYDEENDEEYFDLRITVDSPESAQDLYDWIIDNGYAENDDVESVAPGLEAYINGEDAVVADKEDDEDIENEPVEDDVDECANESVSKKFSKYRKLYEDEMEECGDACKDGECDDKDLNEDDDEDKKEEDKEEGEDKEEKGEEEKDEEGNEGDGDEETEDVPMTAVIISVKKGDEDKCKSEMIDAGISEDDIEILEADEDSNDVELKIDVNSIHELKSYLEGKGIDLEEKIGGEIVDDDEENKEGDEEGDEENKEGDENLDDIDFGDLFSDDEEKEEEK